MSAVHALYHLLKINPRAFSKNEILILEAELFARICSELKKIFREQNKCYFNLIKFDKEKENTMIEANFIRYIINDILSTDEYDISGIAYYTDTPEDVIYDVVTGCNIYPTLLLARKVIDLHRSIRPALYHKIMNKIINDSATQV